MARVALTGAEQDRRLPVWHALSDLFLDSEQQPEDYRRIADVLRASAYDLTTLRHILVEEVAPALGGNLLQVAGEWAGWREDDVRDILMHSLARPGLGRWLKKWLLRRHVDEEWAKIAQLLNAAPETLKSA